MEIRLFSSVREKVEMHHTVTLKRFAYWRIKYSQVVLMLIAFAMVHSNAQGQPLPGIKLHPIHSQTGVAAFTNALPNGMSDTNLIRIAQLLRQRTGTNFVNRNSSSQGNNLNSKQAFTEEIRVRANGTPSVIRVRSNQAKSTLSKRPDKASREKIVRAFLRDRRAHFKISDTDSEFEIRDQDEESTGESHYRLQQRYQGIKVWGGEAAIHLRSDGTVQSMEGAFIPTPRNISTNAAVALTNAIEFVNRDYFGGNGKVFGESELVVDGSLEGVPQLAWKFSMSSDLIDARRFLVNAITSDMIRAVKLVHDGAVIGSGTDALGFSRSLNLWQSGSTYYMVDTSKPMFALTSSPPALAYTEGSVTVLDAGNQPPTSSPTTIPTLYYVTSSSATSRWIPDGVSAAYGLSKVYDYYYAIHGRNSYNNKGSSLVGTIRYGAGYANAFWNQQFEAMFYGGGMARSLDVCGHEVTHGVLDSIGEIGILDYHDQPGALNEAFADIFGEMVEARTKGTNDWLLGSDLGAPIRSMANPNGFGHPSKMSQFVYTSSDQGGVHINSGIINRAFFLLAAGLPNAIGNGDAERIFYRAMTLHLLLQSQFIDARHACISSAEELFGVGSAQALRTADAFDAVEIFDSPPTPLPGTIPAVQAPDSTLGLRWLPGYGYYLVRKESALADPSGGSFVGTIHYLDGKRVSVSGDGSAAVFVTEDHDIGVVGTDGTDATLIGNPGTCHSAAISPDASRAAIVLRNPVTGTPDNRISILNLNTSGVQTFTLYGVTSEGSYIDVVDYADVMDFTSDGRFLIYDAYCFTMTITGEFLDGWTIFAMDTTTGAIQTLLDLNSDFDIGNPALGNTHQNLIALDVTDKATGYSTVISGDLITGDYGIIGTTPGMGVPGYNGDDTALVYSLYDAGVNTDYSIYRRTLAADGITPVGAATLWLANADYGVIYRRGTYVSENVPPQVSLTFPTVGQVFSAPTNIILQASASDADGAVSKVEFYVDSAKIGTDTTAPFTMTWMNASVGSHRITARVFDSMGAASDSLNVPVFVLVPPSLTSQPQSKTVVAGTNVNFTVGSTGTAPLFYQWWKNGSPILSATNSNHSISNVQTNDAGAYSVTVSNAVKVVSSTNAILVVNVPPFITVQPTNQTVIVGSNTSFFVSVAGTLPLKYQWRTNGVNLPGATNSVCTIINTTTNAARSYTVVVTNAAGSVTSSGAVLTVLVPPAFTSQPTNRTVKVGSNAVFNATATGTGPLFYQWRKDGGDIANATNNVYSLVGVQTNDTGVYSLLVSNMAGVKTSSNATLTVTVPPGIIQQPQNLTVIRGSNALFSVTATGTLPLRYQWRSNAVNVLRATNVTYSIANAQTNAAANYSVVITNVAGSITSAVASLTVLMPPALTLQPFSKTVLVGSNVTFTVTAFGTAPLTYQWRKGGVNLSGGTNGSYSIPNVQTNDAGSYSVMVTNVAGSVTSTNATLIVNAKPAIVTQPVSQSVMIGANTSFAVEATGTAPLRYQWRKNSQGISGATNSVYQIFNAQSNAVAAYTVVVTNHYGSVTSAVANLTITVTPPVLKFLMTSENLVLYWPTNWPGFTLQAATNLNLPNSWASNPTPAVVSGTNFVLTNTVNGDRRFYRLKK